MYVCVVEVSCAVPTTVIVVAAFSASHTAPDADPDDTADPCTVIVALLCVLAGVAVMLDTEFATVAVYDVVPDANAGDRATSFASVMADSVATELAARLATNE